MIGGARTGGAGRDAVLEERGGMEVLRWPALDDLGVDAVVTTRAGGVSEGPYATLNLGLHVGDDPERVVENRRRAAGTVGVGLDDLVVCRQAHGREVALVGRADRGRGVRDEDDAVSAADALLTRDAGVGLVVMVADCVPILLVDPRRRAVACVHAGWRGTVARVVEAALDALRAAGSDAAHLVAALGPAIPPTRYQVGPDVAVAVRAGLGDAGAEAALRPDPDEAGRWRFDLWAANRRLLVDAGVPPGAILDGALPTGGGGPFFSDREARPCGRFALLARLR